MDTTKCYSHSTLEVSVQLSQGAVIQVRCWGLTIDNPWWWILCKLIKLATYKKTNKTKCNELILSLYLVIGDGIQASSNISGFIEWGLSPTRFQGSFFKVLNVNEYKWWRMWILLFLWLCTQKNSFQMISTCVNKMSLSFKSPHLWALVWPCIPCSIPNSSAVGKWVKLDTV